MKRALFVLALSLSAAGCGDMLTGLGGSVSGTYTLRTIDGNQLPATSVYVSPSNYVQVLSETLRLQNDGTFTDDATTRDVYNGQAKVSSSTTYGRWAESNGDVVFTDPNDPYFTARGYVSGNTLTIQQFGGGHGTAVFQK